MEVLYRLRIDGNENSVLIKDGEVTYPVFMESLHTADIFNQLLTSGYKFCGLPFDFKREGSSVMDLPVQDYSPSMDEMQDMFDLNSMEKLSQEELRKNMSLEDITYIPEAPGNYSITTREDFLNYLKTYQSMKWESDIRPINYFVHPSARFTVDEWLSGKYSEYFRIMEMRRNLSWQSFNKLREWLVSIGMQPTADAIELVELYNSWGIEGLNVKFVNKQKKTMIIQEGYVMSDAVSDDAFEVHRYEPALIDRYGAIFPPEDIPAGYGGWKIAVKSGNQSNAVKSLMGKLREGQYGVVPAKTKASEDVLFYNGVKDTIKVTPYEISCGTMRMNNFVVRMPDITQKALPHYYWSMSYTQRVKEMSNLYALAYAILQQRKYTADVSTYKALTEVGCDIKTAINYIVDKADTGEDETEPVNEFPTAPDIQMFLDGNYDIDSLTEIQQTRIDTINDIINGSINTDSVADGIRVDAQIDVDTLYRYLYCAHFCKTKVSIADINKLVQNVDEHITQVPVSLEGFRGPTDVLQVKSDVYTIDIPCQEQRAKINGYLIDLKTYRKRQADQCCGFLKVTRIAKEYGVPECRRHVAFEAQTVNLYRDGKIAEHNLDRLMAIYDEKLNDVPVNERAELRVYRRAVCMSEYFRVAEEGVMRFIKRMGGDVVQIPQDLVLSIKSTIKTKITSTAVYCSKMYENGCFTHFCVNADITPYYVYPKGNAVIPAAPLPGLWYEWNSMGAPAIKDKLVSAGVIPANFIPWTMRYMSEQYFSTNEMIKEANLVHYINYCNEFRTKTKANEEFTHAPHLETLLYPHLPDETIRVERSTNLRAEGEVPGMVVSTGEMVTSKTYPEHTDFNIKKMSDTKPLKLFTGFTAEDFVALGDVDSVALPESDTEFYIAVDGDTISFDGHENMPIYTISQLVGKGYPVINLWGRKYIFRDLFGVLWEATV